MARLLRQVPPGGGLHDDIFQVCVSLTNFHFEGNPLREDNFEEYAQQEHRLLAIGKKKKRRLFQEKYRRRKQMRHRMAPDDLPRHHDSDENLDATSLLVIAYVVTTQRHSL
ncbi:hypothetical protein GN244_ATG06570 [Phytophthora infestans]|uniref:Uncharacterized protein n=1 Tax=Phytophthora infestans TaxID=4787 RepID=A0A833SV33_PHYIN|nr:hypothetical protein GN244_ATG06570 [Phytophthora infestans]